MPHGGCSAHGFVAHSPLDVTTYPRSKNASSFNELASVVPAENVIPSLHFLGA